MQQRGPKTLAKLLSLTRTSAKHLECVAKCDKAKCAPYGRVSSLRKRVFGVFEVSHVTYVFGCEENQLWQSLQSFSLVFGEHLVTGDNHRVQIGDGPSCQNGTQTFGQRWNQKHMDAPRDYSSRPVRVTDLVPGWNLHFQSR